MDDESVVDDEPARRRLRPDLGLGRNNGLLFWAHLVWGLGFALQIAIWTLFIESLGASPGQIGLVIGAGAVMRTFLALPAGVLADRVSPKRIVVVAMAAPALGALVLTQASVWWHAMVAAVLIDISGLAIPAVSAYVAAAAPEGERTRAYTYIFNLSIAAGMLVGPAIGGWLAELSGFRLVYALSALCFAAGSALLLLLDDLRPSGGDAEPAAGAARPGYRELLASRPVRLVLAFHALVPLVFIGTTLLPNLLHEQRGYGLGTIGALGSIGSAAGFGFALLVSHWKPLARPFTGISVTLALISLAFVLFITTGNILLVVLGYMLRYSFSSIWSLLSAAIAEVTPERLRGRAYGAGELGVGIGDAAAPLAAGQLYGAGPTLPFVAGLLVAAPLSAVAFLVQRGHAMAVPATVVPEASDD
ncbi:MAG TPA: MFS transporter [Thermomicrobiales bacterium]|nr:MFS transporter [Thermomicrobiales bacterium]